MAVSAGRPGVEGRVSLVVSPIFCRPCSPSLHTHASHPGLLSECLVMLFSPPLFSFPDPASSRSSFPGVLGWFLWLGRLDWLKEIQVDSPARTVPSGQRRRRKGGNPAPLQD